MRNQENIGHIKGGKRSITVLMLTHKVSSICRVIIYQRKQNNTKE